MISLFKYLYNTWDEAKGPLRDDLETLENEINRVGVLASSGVSTTSGGVQFNTRTLISTQVSALPTNSLVILPAPNTGFVNIPLTGIIITRIKNDFTNIDAGASLEIMYNGVPGHDVFGAVPNDTAITNTNVPTTALTDLLAGGIRIARLVPFTNTEGVDEWGAIPSIEDLSALEGQPWVLTFQNNGLGPLTGGDPDNTLFISYSYLTMAVR